MTQEKRDDAPEQMDEEMFEAMLRDLLEVDGSEYVRRADTFRSVGMLTRNRGIVVRMKDGSEMQITIVRSR